MTNEQLYFAALKLIARNFRSAQSIVNKPDMGLDPQEALEYAYENIQLVAERAIKGKRLPK